MICVGGGVDMNLQLLILEFIKAIRSRKKVLLRFYSMEDGTVLERTCAPMDFGPSRRAHLKNDRFHLWDYDSDAKRHTLSINPEQIVELIILEDEFDPREFVTWDTQKSAWFVDRDWGSVS